MTTSLPQPLADFFAATNAHDTMGMLAAFADTAAVLDEGRERHGTAAIREWIEETTRNYQHSVSVLKVETIVTVRVAGNFPGSPVDLRHIVTIDRAKIVRLEIKP